MFKTYYVYIATNYKNTVFYTGITNNIVRRMHEHKNKLVPVFTNKYNINKLVYLENFCSAYEAITAEKKIKGWVRNKKVSLIKNRNPDFENLLDSSLRSK